MPVFAAPIGSERVAIALLKDTPKPLRVFFRPACHLPALTGGVFFGPGRGPSLEQIGDPMENDFLFVWMTGPSSNRLLSIKWIIHQYIQ
jgi:hypothetical protein